MFGHQFIGSLLLLALVACEGLGVSGSGNTDASTNLTGLKKADGAANNNSDNPSRTDVSGGIVAAHAAAYAAETTSAIAVGGHIARYPAIHHLIQKPLKANLARFETTTFDLVVSADTNDANASAIQDSNTADANKEHLEASYVASAKSARPWHAGLIGCAGITVTGAANIDSFDTGNEGKPAKESGHLISLLEQATIRVSAAATITGHILAIGAASDVVIRDAARIGDGNSSVEATGKVTKADTAVVNGRIVQGIAAVKSLSNCDPLDLKQLFARLDSNANLHDATDTNASLVRNCSRMDLSCSNTSGGQTGSISYGSTTSSGDKVYTTGTNGTVTYNSGSSSSTSTSSTTASDYVLNASGNLTLTPKTYASALTVDGAMEALLHPGRYHFPSILVKGAGGIVLKGPGDFVIQVKGDVQITEMGSVKLENGARLTLYVSGKVDVLSTKAVVNDGDASDLIFISNYTREAAGVRLRGASDFRGVVYAPFTHVEISGSASFYGALRGKKLLIDSRADVYFDRFLGTVVTD